MRYVPHRRLRSTGLTIFGALVLVGSLLAANAAATSPPVRQYVPTISPTCAETGSTSPFTAIITNASSSTQNLGSAILRSDARLGFSRVGSFTAPVAANGKTWKVLGGVEGDWLLLRATSSSNALAPGESVSVTFSAKAPSTPGIVTWRTWAFQGTLFFLSPAFSLAPGAAQPTVNVVSPPCGASVSKFCPSSTGCNSGPVQAGPPGSTVTVVVPPCPTQNGCDGNLTVFDNHDPNLPGTTTCGSGVEPPTFNAVSSVTIQPPPGHGPTDPPIVVTFTDEVSVTGDVCKVDLSFPDGRFLPRCIVEESTNPPPCILSEVLGGGEETSTIVVAMTSNEPIMKH